MCTKEKVYKWVFSLGIYAWIIFKDDDGGKGHCICQCTFPKSNQIILVHSEYFVFSFTSQNKNVTENHVGTQQMLFHSQHPCIVKKKIITSFKRCESQSISCQHIHYLPHEVILRFFFSQEMQHTNTPSSYRSYFFSFYLYGDDCFLWVRQVPTLLL